MKMKNWLHNSYLLWTISGLLCLMACENPNQTGTKASQTYFDLKGFVKKQIKNLDKLKPKVKKEILNNGKSVAKTLTIKSWEKELRMFVNADINKTALIGTYTITNTNKAGKEVVKYTTKDSKNSVKEMVIELDDTKKVAKSITITVGSTNVLFASGTKLSFNCKKNPSGNYHITDYQIDGFQKIIAKDKRPYFIKATIL